MRYTVCLLFFFFFQAEDGIRDADVTGVQTCALPIYEHAQGLRRLGFAQPGHSGREHRTELDAENARRVRIAQVSTWARDTRQQDRGLRSAFVELLQTATVPEVAGDLFQEQRVAAAGRPDPADGLF